MKRLPLSHDQVFAGEFAEEYARKHRKIAERFGREFTHKLIERGFTAGRVLDAGCGFGTTALVLAKELPHSEVVGIDLSEPLLDLAIQASESDDPDGRVTFEQADVQAMPYEDDSYAAVINVQMLHIVEDPVAMLDEMERVLTPDGILLMADIRRSWIGWFDRTFKSALTIEEASALVRRSTLRRGIFSSDLLWWQYEA